MMYTLYFPTEGINCTLSNKERISSILLFEAASISIKSKNFPESISSEILESKSGSPLLSTPKLRALANILAVEVFPTPLGPVNKYA